MSLTPQWLDELRTRVSLSALIGRSVRVQKAGREFKACCPFHNEKTPSFTINDEKGFYHCLAGETRVITCQGVAAIADLAGNTHTVLSRSGAWIAAPFRSFGKQRLWEIKLSRNGIRKSLHATDGHRWFVRGRSSETTTSQLRPGQRLDAAFPAGRTDWAIDPEGVRHGIVFGDGTLMKAADGTVNLHGQKDAELAAWFPDQAHHHRERTNDGSLLPIYGGRAFGHMKAFPENNASEAYLLGFLAGYFAADGHVAKDGTVILNSATAAHVDAVRDIATRLGLSTFGRTTQKRRGLHGRASDVHRLHFVASSLAEPFFLLSEARRRHAAAAKAFERLRWQVVSVSPTDRIEEVFCAEVPGEHCFALEDNILTGNCFGCGAHGDAIRWMTDHQGLPFMDAVKELALQAGMEVPAPDPRAAKRAEEQKSLHDVMEAAQAFFVRSLAEDQGAQARAYLASRGFPTHVVKDFGFGYAPDSRTALKEALSQFPEEMLIEAGLRIVVEDRDPYDRFRGRLMLPICDPRGRVIAFGGRILDKTKTDSPKYLNSPDTPLFDKGRTVYNLHRASPASRQSGRVVVVEGYMDVVALAAAGIAEAVAPLGTALTEDQIERLWRMTECPTLCFDGDAAGQRAATRAIVRALPLLRPGHSLRIAVLPDGLDPDDLIKQRGAAAMQDLLGAARSMVEVLWDIERAAAPLVTPEDKAGLKARLMARADTIRDGDIKALYRRELLDRFGEMAYARRERPPFQPGFQGRGQRGQASGRKGPWQPPPPPLSAANTAKMQNIGAGHGLLAAVLAGMIAQPQAIARHAEALARLQPEDPALADLLDALIGLTEMPRNGPQPLESQDVLTILAKRGLRAPTADDYAGMRFGFLDGKAEAAAEELAEAVGLLVGLPAVEAALAEATQRHEAEFSDETFAEQQRLRQRKLALVARLVQMNRNRSGLD
jgi:DNA primase